MTLQEFKTRNNIAKLSFYSSNVDGSTRFVAGCSVNNVSCKVVTREGYDPKSSNQFIYENNILVDGDGVVIPNLYWLSNEEPKQAAFTL